MVHLFYDWAPLHSECLYSGAAFSNERVFEETDEYFRSYNALKNEATFLMLKGLRNGILANQFC